MTDDSLHRGTRAKDVCNALWNAWQAYKMVLEPILRQQLLHCRTENLPMMSLLWETFVWTSSSIYNRYVLTYCIYYFELPVTWMLALDIPADLGEW